MSPNKIPDSKIFKILKIAKKNMPVLITGIFCWIFLGIFTGTSCWIRSIFGIPCPGCGSTRATAAIFRGNIKTALDFHPLIFITLVLLAAYFFTLIFKIDVAEKFKKKRVDIFLWCVFVLYIGVYAVRMILFYPKFEPMTYLDSSLLGRVIDFVKNILG